MKFEKRTSVSAWLNSIFTPPSVGYVMEKREVGSRAEDLLGRLLGGVELARYRQRRVVRILVKPYGLTRTLEIAAEGSISCPGIYDRNWPLSIRPGYWRSHCIGTSSFDDLTLADQVLTLALRAKANPEAFFLTAIPSLYQSDLQRDEEVNSQFLRLSSASKIASEIARKLLRKGATGSAETERSGGAAG